MRLCIHTGHDLVVTGNVVRCHVSHRNIVPVPETRVHFRPNSVKITLKQRTTFHVPRSIDPGTFVTVAMEEPLWRMGSSPHRCTPCSL
jgi:hypothetical protein